MTVLDDALAQLATDVTTAQQAAASTEAALTQAKADNVTLQQTIAALQTPAAPKAAFSAYAGPIAKDQYDPAPTMPNRVAAATLEAIARLGGSGRRPVRPHPSRTATTTHSRREQPPRRPPRSFGVVGCGRAGKVSMDRTGQFGVVRTTGFAGWAIRLGTRSYVNHAFVFVSDDQIVEAQPGGALLSPASKYPDAVVSKFDLDPVQKLAIFQHAMKVKGTPYNFLDIAAITLMTFGLRYKWLQRRAQRPDRLICSQLVDRVYHEAGIQLYDDGRPDGLVTPGDLFNLLAERSQKTGLAA